MKNRASASAISALVTRLTLLLTLVVGLTPVIAYWTISHVRITSQLESTLRIQALALTDFIASQPETWDVALDRLLGHMDRYISYDKGFRVYDVKGEVIFQAAPKVKGPFIIREHTLYDFGMPVGRIEGQESYRNELFIGLAIFGLSLVAAWLIWVPIRGLPLTALAAAERKLKTRERYQRALLDNFPFLVWLKDVDSRYLTVNAKFLEATGQSSEDGLLGTADPGLGKFPLAEKLGSDDMTVLLGGVPKQEEEWVELNGQRRCFAIYKSPVSLDGRIVGTVGYAQDVTRQKELEEQLLYRALHDPLTGLANRSLFLDRIVQSGARAARKKESSFAVVFIDLDRFKIINDSMGHEAGDLLLREVAHRLLACTRQVDTVSRYGGDEFTLVLNDVTPRQTIFAIKRIREALKAPMTLGAHSFQVEASYGIAYGPQEHCQPEDLIRNANIALHVAKSSGRNKIVVYRKTMYESAIQTMRLQSDMRRGLEAGEFFMVYQPIFGLDTLRLAGFEALIRWRHPLRGIVSPGEFIPQAEETGFILELGKFVLAQACKDMVEILAKLPCEEHLTLSVNISPRQFAWTGLADKIDKILAATGLAPSGLVLEITESSIMNHPEATAHILARLKEKGVGIGLDDFGTGYSSMSALQRLPLDRLKVDMSFVSRMNESPEDVEIVRAILTLGQSLQLTTVAEGIETEQQRQALLAMDCILGQGYLYSRPLELADALRTFCQGAAAPAV